MKLSKLRTQRQPRLMIIPMIDIIFFLLVFFMMNTLYMVEQNTIQVTLPQAAAAQQDVKKHVPITVTAQGKVLVGQEEIPFPLFDKRIQTELAQDAETAFVLRADKQAEYGQVIHVLDRLKVLGVRRVAVATEASAR